MAEQALDLETAGARLDKALAALEGRLKALKAQGTARSGDEGSFEQDRARLAGDLDDAKARERALEEAAAQASEALGRAAEEVRAILAGEE